VYKWIQMIVMHVILLIYAEEELNLLY